MPTLAIALSGCVATPITPSPELTSPLAWDTRGAGDETLRDLTAAEFWAGFGSPGLQNLLREAEEANPDLLIAIDHLLIARDTTLAAQARQRPSLSFNAGPVDTAATAVAEERNRRQAVYGLAFNASYELDFWGRLGNLSASAQSESDARRYDAETARIGLMSLVAQAYFDLAQFDEAAPLWQRRRELAEERLSLQIKRQVAGRIDSDALSEAHDAVDLIRTQQDEVSRQRRLAESRIALLLGRPPQGYSLAGGSLREQIRLPTVPAGLPSTLLQRRPDLRAAAARLAAAQHRVAAAQAEQFPQIRLTAQLGVATDVLHRAAHGAVGLFGIGPEIELPIYDGGARKARLDASGHEADIARLEYRKAAIGAFADVEHALLRREATQAMQLQAGAMKIRSEDAYRAASARLESGRGSRLDEIAAEEKLLDAEQHGIASYRAQLDSVLALFQSLGGGWRAFDADEASTRVSLQEKPT